MPAINAITSGTQALTQRSTRTQPQNAAPPGAQQLTSVRPPTRPATLAKTLSAQPQAPKVTPSPTPNTGMMGDIDGDGRLSAADGKALLSYLFGNGATPEGLANADLDGDGSVNITDAVQLFNMLNNRTRPQPLAPVSNQQNDALTLKPNPAYASRIYTR